MKPRKISKVTRKRVFAEFVNSRRLGASDPNDDHQITLSWLCCDETFNVAAEIHKHVAKEHGEIVNQATTLELQKVKQDSKCQRLLQDRSEVATIRFEQGELSLRRGSQDLQYDEKDRSGDLESSKKQKTQNENSVTETESHKDTEVCEKYRETLPWLPSEEDCQHLDKNGEGQILLYYRYVDIEKPEEIAEWQRVLCQRLHLAGKIRLATEGLNGTVGGSVEATNLYIKAVRNHPLFIEMTALDFKKSRGDSSHFPKGLKVGVHQEIVPMGVDPNTLSYRQAGEHLTPEEFHRELDHELQSQSGGKEDTTLLLDCRNFYESKIGQFKGAVTPNIRKFSYWPEYVDKNLDLFQDKRVIMYCTGGIRCERGSAYLKSKGVCKEILQLKGGVHNYLDQYPDGHFRGKLFVFDDRYAISTNQDVVSNCFHCDQPWDEYQPCSSTHCHQYVLSCPACRASDLTSCCKLCGELNDRAEKQKSKTKEECLCTRRRERIPEEK
ncbi:thiosulfate sulfurtransferase/rhodanese-like domain-containing protein 2 [Asterias rubens]|uniref:thiosulfate sulfurtransferase/rhodanese-like domain-containing protein 2 n=1 Tax=Asterias rubens TaxID=7604 RepID=UPI00145502A9|nr:thiosulfate sulfurtransferase/rhodanese-like domain-containing protein 2 [Asterias rubens]